MIKQYGFVEMLKNLFYVFQTKFLFPKARIVRTPIYIRGKKFFVYGNGLSTGRYCRFDLNSNSHKYNGKKRLIIGGNCKIGDYVHIVSNENVIIGNDCLIASKVFITDTSHGEYVNDKRSSPDIKPDSRPLKTNKVFIGDRVWIGENVVILPGVEIGSGSIIGANAVVNKNVEKNTIVAGIPAKTIKKYNFQLEKWERV